MYYFERKLSRNDFLKLLPRNSIGAGSGVLPDEFAKEIVKMAKPKEFYLTDDPGTLFQIQDNYLDWIYLDCRDYEHIKRELQAIDKKMKAGGLIAGHDWQPDETISHHSVNRVVAEFCLKHNWGVMYRDSHGQWCLRRKT